MTTKTCAKCGEEKPLDGFHKDKSKRGGRNSRCKECVSEYDRRYREENREEMRERSRRYKHKNREKVLEQKRRYREKNREKIREKNRIYREESREVMNAKNSLRMAATHEVSNALSTVQPYVRWSEEEDIFLMADNGMTVYGKATHLGRTYASCTSRLYYVREKRRTTNV